MKRVLVVEDDQDLGDSLLLLMEGLGAKCVKASSFAEVKRISVANLDLAILDISLGRGEPSGIEVCEYLRRRQPGIKVIFFTGHAASHPLVQAASELAGVKVLAKPADIDELGCMVSDAS